MTCDLVGFRRSLAELSGMTDEDIAESLRRFAVEERRLLARMRRASRALPRRPAPMPTPNPARAVARLWGSLGALAAVDRGQVAIGEGYDPRG